MIWPCSGSGRRGQILPPFFPLDELALARPVDLDQDNLAGKDKNSFQDFCNAARQVAKAMVKTRSTVRSVIACSASVWLIALALAACDAGYAAGDRDDGHQLARQWCSGCHSVDQANQGSDAAPSFDSIATSSGEDKAWLKAWLSAPHPTMPDMNLSREEIDDIAAYLSSLSKP